MQASGYAAQALYGLLVFAGTALLGLVVAPYLGFATGLFAIDTESRGFFSLLTLKAMPALAALSVLCGATYPWLAKRGPAARGGLFVASVLVAWLVGAALALFMLG